MKHVVTRWVGTGLLLALATGCYSVGIRSVALQPVAQIPVSATIDIPPATRDYTISFHCWTAGIANRWKVLVGDAVVKYANAYLPSLFPKGNDVKVRIDVTHFEVSDFRSIADVQFTVTGQGRELMKKTYHGESTSHVGVMLVGGAFAMEPVIASSMHQAFTDIFSRFTQDVRHDWPQWQVARKH